MRLKIAPQRLVEWIGLSLGMAPRPMIETMGGLLLARTIMAGVRIGLFDALEQGPATAAELAQRLDADESGTAILASALASSDYLLIRGGRYEITPLARKWLLKGAPQSVVDFLLFMHDQWDWFRNVEDAIRSGKGVDIHALGQGPAFWERYMRALADLARVSEEEIVRAIPLRRAPRRMLDVAGGHGRFSAALCRRNPGLRAEILDLEDAISAARPILASTGVSEQIRFRAGDMRTVDWGSGHDLILLFNILHHLTEKENRAAFARARAALTPGGTIAVWDFQSSERGRKPDQVGGLMGLFFYVTSGRRAYPVEQIRSWVGEAGFQEIRVRTLPRAPFGFLLTATAP